MEQKNRNFDTLSRIYYAYFQGCHEILRGTVYNNNQAFDARLTVTFMCCAEIITLSGKLALVKWQVGQMTKPVHLYLHSH